MYRLKAFSFAELVISISIMMVLSLLMFTAVTKRFVAEASEEVSGTYHCYKDESNTLMQVTRVLKKDGSEEVLGPQAVAACSLEIQGSAAKVEVTAVGGGGGGAYATKEDILDDGLIQMNANGKSASIKISGDNPPVNFLKNLYHTEANEGFDASVIALNSVSAIDTLDYNNLFSPNKGKCIYWSGVPNEVVAVGGFTQAKKDATVIGPRLFNIYVNASGNFEYNIAGARITPSMSAYEICSAATTFSNPLSSVFTVDGYNQAVLSSGSGSGYAAAIRSGSSPLSYFPISDASINMPFVVFDGYDGKSTVQNVSGGYTIDNEYILPTPGGVVRNGVVLEYADISRTSFEDLKSISGGAINDGSFTALNPPFGLLSAGDSVIDDEKDSEARQENEYSVNYSVIRATGVATPYGENGSSGETSPTLEITNATDFKLLTYARDVGDGGLGGTLSAPNGQNGGTTRANIENPAQVRTAAGGVGGRLVVPAVRPLVVPATETTLHFHAGVYSRANEHVYTEVSNLSGDGFLSDWATNATKDVALKNPYYSKASMCTAAGCEPGQAPSAMSFGTGGAGMNSKLQFQRLLGVLVYRQYATRSVLVVNKFVNYPQIVVADSHNGKGAGGAIVVTWVR